MHHRFFVRNSELSPATPGVDHALALLTNIGLAPGASELLSDAAFATALTAWLKTLKNGGVRCKRRAPLANSAGRTEPPTSF